MTEDTTRDQAPERGGASDAAPSRADKRTSAPRKPKDPGAPSLVAVLRTRLAQVVWTAAVVCALFLAVGALLIALGANTGNALVRFVLDVADALDLEVFARRNGVFEMTGSDAATKNALANWGLAAVAYLVVGRVVDRIVRP